MCVCGYERYISDVLTGKIKTNQYIKLAVERYKNFSNRDDMYFNKQAVENVIDFIGNIKLWEGSKAGQQFILTDWQQFVIANIYGFFYKVTNKRVTTDVFLFMSRKMGKSTFAGAIAMNQLINDGEAAPSVILAANSTMQSSDLLKKTLNFSTSLDPKEKVLKKYRNSIKCKINSGELKIVSTNLKSIEGANASTYILDEYHQADNNDVLNSLKLSQGARSNPLGVIITTAGKNTNSPCKQLYDNSIEVLRGLKTNDNLFSLIYTLDDDDDWLDPENWIKSNPNLGVTVSSEKLKEQIEQAKFNTSDEPEIKTKVLNLWVNSVDVWLSDSLIQNKSKNIDLNTFSGLTCVVGVDLSSVSDLTAVSVLIYNPDDETYYFKTKYFLPNSALTEHKQKELYKKWHYQKEIELTAGNVVDYDYILTEILNINRILPVQAVYYDTYNATQFAINATDAGLNMQPFSQALANFNRPTKEFERLIKGNKVVIDNNQITRFCFKNVALKFDHNNNCKPVKSNDGNKIDGVISMLMALGGSLLQPKYETTIFTF